LTVAKKKPRTRLPEGKRAPKAAAAEGPGGELSFGRRNMAMLGGAVLCIVGGYLLLAGGSTTLAPILLVLGYCVLVPYGLAATH